MEDCSYYKQDTPTGLRNQHAKVLLSKIIRGSMKYSVTFARERSIIKLERCIKAAQNIMLTGEFYVIQLGGESIFY